MLSRPQRHPASADNQASLFQIVLPCLALSWMVLFWAFFFTSDLPNANIPGLGRLEMVIRTPALLWNLLFPHRPPGETSGWHVLLERAPVLGIALFVWGTAYACGSLSLRWLGLHDRFDRVTRLAYSGGLGMAWVSLWTLATGYLGFLNRTLFVSAFVLIILLEALLAVRGFLRRTVDSQLPTSSEGPPGWMWGACLVFLLPILLGAMLPSTDFDVNEYHLEGPKEYFLSDAIRFLPHNVYTSFPFLTEMLSLCSMVLTDDWWKGGLVGKTVLMQFAVITGLSIFALTRRVAGTTAAAWSVVIFLSTPWVYRISTIAYTEGALCCYVILSLLALIHWKDSLSSDGLATAKTRRALLCGLLAGNAVATKYPGMVLVAIPLAVAMGIFVLGQRLSTKPTLRMAAMYVLGGMMTFGPWAAKNLYETGNPVYPLMYSILGGVDWDEELNEKWKAGHSRPSPLLKAPQQMWRELQANVHDVTIRSDWQSPLMFGLAPLAFLWWPQRRLVWMIACAALTVLGVWYTLTHLIDRFWVPVLPLIAVLAGIGVENVQQVARTSVPGRACWIMAVCLFMATFAYNLAFITSGLSGDNSYLTDYSTARQKAKGWVPGVVLMDSRLTPNDGRVLYVGDAMVFDAEHPYRYHTVFDSSLLEQWTARKTGPDHWELRSIDEIRKRLASEGVEHVLVNWREILRYRTTYGYTDFVSPARLRELVELGIFEEVAIDAAMTVTDWDSLPASWKVEIQKWGPELQRRTYRGKPVFRQYQHFRVVPPAE